MRDCIPLSHGPLCPEQITELPVDVDVTPKTEIDCRPTPRTSAIPVYRGSKDPAKRLEQGSVFVGSCVGQPGKGAISVAGGSHDGNS